MPRFAHIERMKVITRYYDIILPYIGMVVTAAWGYSIFPQITAAVEIKYLRYSILIDFKID